MARIEPLQRQYVSEAINVICAGDCEIYRDLDPDFYGAGDVTPAMVQRVRQQYVESGFFDDVLDFQRQYVENGGTFLVLMDEGLVGGTGAIKRIEETVAELGSLWFLPEYRGRGLGKAMVQQLLVWARDAGYGTVRLDTSNRCREAVGLFRHLGFLEIESYKGTTCTDVFLEKTLKHSDL